MQANNQSKKNTEWIPNGHSFNILHMEGIAGELKSAGITQNEMKSVKGTVSEQKYLTE